MCKWIRSKDELPLTSCDHLLLWDKAWDDMGFLHHGGFDKETGKFWAWERGVNNDALEITYWSWITLPPEGD